MLTDNRYQSFDHVSAWQYKRITVLLDLDFKDNAI